MSGAVYKFERDMLHGKDIYITRKEDSRWFEKHWHNYYEMIYYKKCRGSCELNGESYPITDRSLFFLTPKDFHRVRAENSDDACSVIIAFSERMIDGHILGSMTRGPLIAYGIPQGLEDKLEELCAVISREGRYCDVYARHLFNCILIELLNSARAVEDRGEDISPIVRESISVILSDPTAELSLAYFASRFQITEAYFSRLFHKHTGIPFKKYLTLLRLEYAKQLLKEDRLPIIDVGYECGFNTPSQFFRAFKGEYGASPSEYRRRAVRE